MRTALFLLTALVSLGWIAWRRKLPPLRQYGLIDAIVPAYNEELCIVPAVERLLRNPYFHRIIVVNDGSTDGTAAIIDDLGAREPRVTVVHQANSGKGGALMNGIGRSDREFVFLSDADTLLRADGDDLGYMLAEMAEGAHAVGGVPLSNLDGAGILPHVRASTKLAIITLQRTFQQLVGGAPFLISGACGLFRREVLLEVPFSDRTKVEDLDLTWSLVSRGYVVRQSNRSFVYSQEPNSLTVEWRRWRRWIAGYAVCMRLHRNLLPTRFGLLTIIPVVAAPFLTTACLLGTLLPAIWRDGLAHLPLHLLPWAWVLITYVIGAAAALHYRKPLLVLVAPAALIYLLMACTIWVVHGLKALCSGREPQRDKPKRYANVVG